MKKTYTVSTGKEKIERQYTFVFAQSLELFFYLCYNQIGHKGKASGYAYIFEGWTVK